MPRVKKAMVSITNGMGDFGVEVVFHVNSLGEFYCAVPDALSDAYAGGDSFLDSVWVGMNGQKRRALFSKQLKDLFLDLKQALQAAYAPTVTREPVILYNLESHVSFAVDDDGRIFPNAAASPTARWPVESSRCALYGDHHAQSPSRGGYSLTVGARVMMRVTTSMPGRTAKVGYESLLGEEDQRFKRAHPEAGRLNSWCSFTLPKGAKEIPYSDKAAAFFYQLMLGMAGLSKMIQESTFDQADLLQLIERGSGVPLLAPSAKVGQITEVEQ